MWLHIVRKNIESVRQRLREAYKWSLLDWEEDCTYRVLIDKTGFVRTDKQKGKAKPYKDEEAGDLICLKEVKSYNIWDCMTDEEIHWDKECKLLRKKEKVLLEEYCAEHGVNYSFTYLGNIDIDLYRRVYRKWVLDYVLTSMEVDETVNLWEIWIISELEKRGIDEVAS